MAVIVFYDTTELDEQQLTNALRPTDHYWKFVSKSLSVDNAHTDAEIVSVMSTSKITAEIMDSIPRLTLICCRSIDVNNVDLSSASQRGITVLRVPTYGGPSVAEYVFTLLLALKRLLPTVLEATRKPFSRPEIRGHDLVGKTMGVIGVGNIGKETLRIAKGFSMRTLAYDVKPVSEIEDHDLFEYVDLDTLLSESDVVSLHVPYNRHTHHLLNSDRLNSMKEGSILVNTSRGGVVDTGALVSVLDRKHLAGAALDAVEGDFIFSSSEEMMSWQDGKNSNELWRHSAELASLQRMPNVIISPQNAYNTFESFERINNTTAKNIIDFYNGYRPNEVKYEPPTPGKLILIRHAESEWNASGVWSGITDICLSDKGEKDCVGIGEMINRLGISIDIACYTEQRRTRQTLDGILPHIASSKEIPQICVRGLNERNYGKYTGMDKWRVKEMVGEEEFNRIRRGWDVSFPNGETLKQVYERVVPAYQNEILTHLREGENVLVVAHGNSLRALIKYLDRLSVEEVESLEMLMSQILIYDVDPETGHSTGKQVIESGITIESKF